MLNKDTPIYMHVEGMDFAGKSVVSEQFIANQNEPWQIWNNTISPHVSNPISRLADDLQQQGIFDSEIHGMLYNAALLAEIRSFRSPQINTIQDSSIFLRSMAYHIVTGKERLMRELELFSSEHPRFDASYMLTAEHSARLDRLAMRKAKGEKVSEHDLMFVKFPERFYAMEKCLIELVSRYFHGKVLDTSRLSVIQVAEVITDDLTVIKADEN